jgi:hypothetical protein
VQEINRKQLLNVQKRVEKESKISKRAIGRILGVYKKHEAQSSSFSTPKKTQKVPKRVADIDDFDKCVVRCIIQEFYVQEKNVGNYLSTTSEIEGQD